MNNILSKIGKKKWFVPLVIITMLLIAFSSLLYSGDEDGKPNEIGIENRLEEMCNSVRGISNAKVMVTYCTTETLAFSSSSANAKIKGIAVLCNGADDPDAHLSLYKMIKSLFDISGGNITITERS